MKKEPFVTKTQLDEIVKEYPTPFHLYDEKGIRENVKALKEAFAWNKGYKEYFAVKATPNPKLKKLPLTGLDPDKRYYCSRNDRTYYGDELMNMGLLLDMEFTGSSARKDSVTKKNSGTDAGDFTSQMYVFECVDN